MEVSTHLELSNRLCGEPVELEAGRSRVVLDTIGEMAADSVGLVHGGFIFGAADYAAMLAVNDPNVVLGAADIKFLAPVRVGQTVELDARVEAQAGRKQIVAVEGRAGGVIVFRGEFTCFVLDHHVLEGSA
jgi:acyl-coenzyme A thioesterase PaaI-like protein